MQFLMRSCGVLFALLLTASVADAAKDYIGERGGTYFPPEPKPDLVRETAEDRRKQAEQRDKALADNHCLLSPGDAKKMGLQNLNYVVTADPFMIASYTPKGKEPVNPSEFNNGHIFSQTWAFEVHREPGKPPRLLNPFPNPHLKTKVVGNDVYVVSQLGNLGIKIGQGNRKHCDLFMVEEKGGLLGFGSTPVVSRYDRAKERSAGSGGGSTSEQSQAMRAVNEK